MAGPNGTRNTTRRWAVAVTLVFLLLALFAPLQVSGPAPQQRTIELIARSFEFLPGTVRVNRGDTVTIRLQAEDVVHGMYVDGYDIQAQAEPGQPAELRFVADRAGAFRIRCAVPCGNLHPFMIGKLVVGPNLIWLRALLAAVITALGTAAAFWRS